MLAVEDVALTKHIVIRDAAAPSDAGTLQPATAEPVSLGVHVAMLQVRASADTWPCLELG